MSNLILHVSRSESMNASRPEMRHLSERLREFTTDEVAILQRSFAAHPRPGVAEYQRLATQFDLELRRIQSWCVERRISALLTDV